MCVCVCVYTCMCVRVYVCVCVCVCVCVNNILYVVSTATCFDEIHKEKIQQDAPIYQHFIVPYLYETQNVSGDTPLIIRSLKLH